MQLYRWWNATNSVCLPSLRKWQHHKASSFSSTFDISLCSLTHIIKGKSVKQNAILLHNFPKSSPSRVFKASQTWKERSGQTGKLPRSDLTRNGMTLIFPGHTTVATQIKSFLFTVTFPFPSFLREIFPPSAAISVTGYPRPKQKAKWWGDTKSIWVTRSRLNMSHCNLCVIVVYVSKHLGEKTKARDGTRWLIATVRVLMQF